MKKILRLSSLLVAATLAACGGGGGSGGTSEQQYSITLRADKTQLPINIDPINNVASTGSYAPYTTTLYVSAETGGKPIPGGEDIFGCNMAGGLDSGALYYLDGDKEHQTEDEKPGAYRSITLGSNSGGNSFHFHSSNQAGTARIVCSVTDPRDKKVYSASVDITVGAATGKPLRVAGQAQALTTLGTSENLAHLPNAVAIEATVYDDANQLIPNPSAANLQVSILPLTTAADDASIGAQVVAGSQRGTSVRVQSVGGTALFSLQSGRNEGPILLQLVADRADNNVTNGIQEPITSYLVVSAYHEIVKTDPLAMVTTDISTEAVIGMPYSFVLEASGGTAPYAWSVAGGMPAGLTLSSAGLISGTPAVKTPGDYPVVVKVTDAKGQSISKNFTLKIGGTAAVDPLSINLSGCSNDINSACPLPNATLGSLYQYGFSATGGDPAVPVTWTFSGMPAWLSSSAAGNFGFVSGTPIPTTTTNDTNGNPVTTPGTACGATGFFVTATRGTVTATKRVSLNVNGDATHVCP